MTMCKRQHQVLLKASAEPAAFLCGWIAQTQTKVYILAILPYSTTRYFETFVLLKTVDT